MEHPRISAFRRLQDRVREDSVCRGLLAEYETVDARLLAAFPEMTEPHREAVMDYIGLLGELTGRILRLALEEEKPKQPKVPNQL